MLLQSFKLNKLKACPHCRGKVRLSPLSRHYMRQSHFSATVWTGLKRSGCTAARSLSQTLCAITI